MIGEYDSAGAPIYQVAYMGQTPIARFTPAESQTIHTDHLGTPRALADATDKVVWKWDGDAFGMSLPDEDPDGDSVKLSFPMRFPGQLYDDESGLHYNVFRDYDPTTGRYLQADPIGLGGGVSLYGYVGGGPVGRSDPMGLVFPVIGAYVAPYVLAGTIALYRAAPMLNRATVALEALALESGTGASHLWDAAKMQVALARIRGLNSSESMTNCQALTCAVNDILHGRIPGSVEGWVPLKAKDFATQMGGAFSRDKTKEKIIEEMMQAGHGATGIVEVPNPWGARNHVINVVNDNGAIVFIDAQPRGDFIKNGQQLIEEASQLNLNLGLMMTK